MRVSAAQFFAMSEAERKQVTHIDMDLDRAAERRGYIHRFIDEANPHEPGTDWIKDKPL